MGNRQLSGFHNYLIEQRYSMIDINRGKKSESSIKLRCITAKSRING
jgi:hypothetical protein